MPADSRGLFPGDSALVLRRRIADRTARAGVIGLGYVGLPLSATIAQAGFPVTGFDVDPNKVVMLNGGQSYIDAVPSEVLARLVEEERFTASADFSALSGCDIIIICVPTPLTRHREPDLSFVESTARIIGTFLRPGQFVVLESTTYPGTTEEVLKPLLEAGGLRSGEDFFLGFSPERENPGSLQHSTRTIPKIVAGEGQIAAELAESFYGAVVEKVVVVSSLKAAEMTKIAENTFRAVNIALVNEWKLICEAMGIDVWEVIDAAATKPFGFMPFYPGPGLGGHCIPIDPFYLSWKARAIGVPTKFIELAGEINTAMPAHVIATLERELDRRLARSLGSARILILGLAYKKNVSDIRESPALVIMERLIARGTRVEYHDPHAPEVPPTREHASLAGRRSVELDGGYDAVLIVTDHDAVDYGRISALAPIVVDTRNVMMRKGFSGDHIVRA